MISLAALSDFDEAFGHPILRIFEVVRAWKDERGN
jgi:hypothetical protein